MTLNEIEGLAKKLAEARGRIAALVAEMETVQAIALRNYLPNIKAAVGKAAERHGELFAGIDGSRELFVKPKSQIFHAIKVGLRKGAGGISFEDEAFVIGRIEKKLPERAESLIKSVKSLRKGALNDLEVSDLKAIGCTVEATSDVVLIKPVDSAVDKVVNALLKSATDEAQKEAA